MNPNTQFQMNSNGAQLQMHANQVQMNLNSTQVQMDRHTRAETFLQQHRNLRRAHHRLIQQHNMLTQEHQSLRIENDELRRHPQEAEQAFTALAESLQRAQNEVRVAREALEAEKRRSARLEEDNRHLRDLVNDAQLNQSRQRTEMLVSNVVPPRYQHPMMRTTSGGYVTIHHQQQQQQQMPTWNQQYHQQQQQQQFAYQPAPAYGYQGPVANQQPLATNETIDLTVDAVPFAVAPDDPDAPDFSLPLAPLPIADDVGVTGETPFGFQPPCIDPSLLTISRSESPQPFSSNLSGEETWETITPETQASQSQGARDNSSEEPPAKRRQTRRPDWLPPLRNRTLNAAQNNLHGRIVEEQEENRIIEEQNAIVAEAERKARMEQVARERKAKEEMKQAKVQQAREQKAQEKAAKDAKKEEEKARRAAEKLARDEQVKEQRARERAERAAEKKAAEAAEKRKRDDEEAAAAAAAADDDLSSLFSPDPDETMALDEELPAQEEGADNEAEFLAEYMEQEEQIDQSGQTEEAGEAEEEQDGEYEEEAEEEKEAEPEVDEESEISEEE